MRLVGRSKHKPVEGEKYVSFTRRVKMAESHFQPWAYFEMEDGDSAADVVGDLIRAALLAGLMAG